MLVTIATVVFRILAATQPTKGKPMDELETLQRTLHDQKFAYDGTVTAEAAAAAAKAAAIAAEEQAASDKAKGAETLSEALQAYVAAVVAKYTPQ